MTSKEYNEIRRRLEAIISSLEIVKDDIKEAGGFITDDMSEEFDENLDSAIISIQDCVENIDADEALKDLKNNDINGELEGYE